MVSTQSTVGVFDAGAGTPWPVEGSSKTPFVTAKGLRPARSIKGTAAATARFVLHFLEMAIAMALGMAIFVPFKLALVDQGYTVLLDRGSIEYQALMNLFMVVPMVLWMRARGHRWQHGVEMAAAMVVPVAVILFVCSLGIESTFPWFTTGLTGLAMFLGMLGYMLYRRDMYTGGYSFGWIRRRRAHVQASTLSKGESPS